MAVHAPCYAAAAAASTVNVCNRMQPVHGRMARERGAVPYPNVRLRCATTPSLLRLRTLFQTPVSPAPAGQPIEARSGNPAKLLNFWSASPVSDS